jgi:hypothetical protein
VVLAVRDGGTEHTDHVSPSRSEVTLTGPGKALFYVSGMIDMGRRPSGHDANLKLELGRVGDDRPLSLIEDLTFSTPPDEGPGWYSARENSDY